MDIELLSDTAQERLRAALDRLIQTERPRYRRLWAYFRNPMRVCGRGLIDRSLAAGAGTDRPYRQAQEWGLPARITGVCSGAEPFVESSRGSTARKEVVIENDIGWRVDTMVDYLFGRPVVISSAAPDPRRRELIGKLLRMILAHNGGIGFLQQVALFGSVYGFADILVKVVNCAGDQTSSTNDATACGTSTLGEAPAPAGPKTQANHDGQSYPGGEGTPGTQTVAGPASETAAAESHGGGGAGDDAPAHADPAAAAVSGNNDNTSRIADATTGDDALLERIARMIRLEIVEPARALPLLSPDDYRVVQAYGQVWEREDEPAATARSADMGFENRGWFGRVWGRLVGDGYAQHAPLRVGAKRRLRHVVELITAGSWFRFEDGRVVARGRNSLGEIPLVHIQNSVAAFEYSGASDVEPLIPLQDELNTRLSDRAHRVSLQSFKMYLAKGIEAFGDQPVAPGRIWTTDDDQARIDEFGGDASCPSEESHIADLREALDKSSGVTPIAAGAIKNRIGRLTSAAALRVTLLALLSKTDKKRALYGAGIERLCALALKWLDAAGVFATTEAERRVELNWPSPLPENEMEKLTEAEAKVRLGVDRAVVLRELGY